MNATEVKVGLAKAEHLEGIVEIYNDAIAKTTATFDTQIKPANEHQAWFDQHDERYAILVATPAAADDAAADHPATDPVLAWGSLSRWSDRCGYDQTAEVSYYVAEEYRGLGLGRKMLTGLIEHARGQEMFTLIARMAGENEASIRLATSLGFEPVGTLKKVGWKFGRRIDVYIAQLLL